MFQDLKELNNPQTIEYLRDAIQTRSAHLCSRLSLNDQWSVITSGNLNMSDQGRKAEICCRSCFKPIENVFTMLQFQKVIDSSDPNYFEVEIQTKNYHVDCVPHVIKCDFLGCNRLCVFDAEVYRYLGAFDMTRVLNDQGWCPFTDDDKATPIGTPKFIE